MMNLTVKIFLTCILLTIFSCGYLLSTSYAKAPPPTVSISAGPGTISEGFSTTLNWTTKKADNVIIDPGNINVSVNGSLDVSPRSTTTYTITATGSTGTSTASVTVNVIQTNHDPVAENDYATTTEDSLIILTVLGNDSDSDGDTLNIESISQPTDGSVADNGDGTLTFSPDENLNGTTSFYYSINDGNGGTASATVFITITAVNDRPVANAQSIATTENSPVSITLSAEDIDGDSLFYNVIDSPQNGILSGTEATLTYTPNQGYVGQDSFTFQVNDGAVDSNTASITIEVTRYNNAPAVEDDSFITDEDTPFTTGNVLTNDADADGDPLSINSFSTPANGTIIDNGNGTFTYAPFQNYNGTDNFTYTVKDGNGGSGSANVLITINPVNDSPSAENQSTSTLQDTAKNIILDASDIDDDPLSFIIVDTSVNGSLSSKDGDSLITYTPSAGFSGQDTFTFKANDGQTDSNTAIVTIFVTESNSPPVATNDTAATLINLPITVNVLENDYDDHGTSCRIVSYTEPAHGTVFLNIDNTFTFSPAEDYIGSDSFSYTIDDSMGGTSSADVAITIYPQFQTKYALRIKDSNGTAVPKGRKRIVRTSSGKIYYIAPDGPSSLSQNISAQGWIDVLSSPNGTTWQTDSSRHNEWLSFTKVGAAVDSQDIIHMLVTDYQYNLLYHRFNTEESPAGNSSWENTETISPDVTSGSDAIAIDANDVPHVIFLRQEKYKGTYYSALYYANRIGGSWRTLLIVPKEAKRYIYEYDIAIGPDNLPYILTDTGISKADANDPTSFSDMMIDGCFSFVIHSNGDVRVARRNNGVYSHYVHDHNMPWNQGWTLFDSESDNPKGLLTLLNDEAYLVWASTSEFKFRKGFEPEQTLAIIPDGYGYFSSQLTTRWSFYNNHNTEILDFGEETSLSRSQHYWYTNYDPEASMSFYSDKTYGFAPLTIQFHDNSYPASGEVIASWEWDFDGDGIIDSVEKDPSFTYTDLGSFPVSLTITDFHGHVDTLTSNNFILVDVDSDKDTFLDGLDNCPDTYNMTQVDLDHDGLGDACDSNNILLDQASSSKGIQTETSPEASPINVTELLTNGFTNQGVLVQKDAQGYDILAFEGEVDTADLNSATVKLYINDMAGESTQATRIYPYQADGTSVQEDQFLDFFAVRGWNTFVVTDLLSTMNGFGFTKFRLVALEEWFQVSEGGLTGTSAVGLDEWDIEVDPPLIDFGFVNSNEYHWTEIKVRNGGAGSLIIDGVAPPSGPFNLLADNCSGKTLDSYSNPQHGFCSLVVNFAPGAEGNYSDSIIINSNDHDAPAFLLPITASAQTPSTRLSGTVYNVADEATIEGVDVSLKMHRIIDYLSPYDNNFTSSDVAEDDGIRECVTGLPFTDEVSRTFDFRDPYKKNRSIKIRWNGRGIAQEDDVFAQSFTAGATGSLTKVSLLLARDEDSAYGKVQVFLKSAINDNEDTILASSQEISPDKIPRYNPDWIDFSFPSPVNIVEGQVYYLELQAYARNDYNPGAIKWSYETPTAYSGGNRFDRTSCAWDSVTDSSFALRTYVSEVLDQQTTSNPTSSIGWIATYGYIKLSVLNRAEDVWSDIVNYRSNWGHDDLTLEGILDTDLSDYYDENGWISFKVTFTNRIWSNPETIIGTDSFNAFFIDTYSTFTDTFGIYTLSGLTEGDYEIDFYKHGYYPQQENGTLTEGQTNVHDASLTPVPSPTVHLSADKNNISPYEQVVLSWTSTNADTCVLMPGLTTVNCNNSLTISPEKTTTYTLSATNSNHPDVATSSVTITVTWPEPTASINADPSSVLPGEQVTLTWVADGSETCVLEPGPLTVSCNDTLVVTPLESTEYTLTASNPGHSVTESVIVTVNQPQPTVEFTADKVFITEGESVLLTWNTTYAESVSINNGIGIVDHNDSMYVFPTTTTFFIITATGPGGTINKDLRVIVKSSSDYLYGNPTPAEQAMLEAINRTRLDPSAEAYRLDIDLNEGLAEGTISTKAVQPLTFSASLQEAAFLHSLEMVNQQYYGHDSLDGRAFWDRVLDTGYQYDTAGENIAFKASTAPLNELETLLTFHNELFVDNDFEGRGHRLNILYSPFKETGFAPVYGSCGDDPFCYKFTCDFASSATQTNSFLLGVVYDDLNDNGLYDAGEGIENVNIKIFENDDETSTAFAGGYAIPLTSGYYTVKATLPDGKETEKEFNITDWNVKIDFLFTEFNHPQPHVSINSNHQNIELGDVTTLTWSSTNAGNCTIEPNIGPIDCNGSMNVFPTMMTTYKFTGSGFGGIATDHVTVCVSDPSAPIVGNINATPENIPQGEPSTLSWTTSGADSCIIEPSIGDVPPNGTLTVSPEETIEYRITASGVGGTAQDSALIYVTQPYTTVNGFVINSATGDPIPDATVSANDGIQVHTTLTGTLGEFEVSEITPGEISLNFSMTGFTPLDTVFNLEGGRTKTVHIHLNENDSPPEPTEVTASGLVKDAQTGAPLEGATVSITDSDKTLSTTTLHDGSYSVSGVRPGLVEITVNHTGYTYETKQSYYDSPGIWQNNFELYSESALVTVQGSIINSNTLQPEEGVNVIFEGTDTSYVTLSDGVFILNDVPFGQQTLHIVKDNFNDSRITLNIDTDPYEMDFVLPYTDGLTYPETITKDISGIINDSITAQPIAGALVKVIGTSIGATTDQDGQFSLTGLPDGNIQIMAMAVNHEAVAVYPTVVSDGADTFVFHLSPTTRGTITGTVTDAETGEPIRNVRVGIGKGALVGAQTEPDGSFNMLGVPSGNYTVTAFHPAYVKREMNSITVQDNLSGRVDFVLTPRPQSGSLEGIVTDKISREVIYGAVLTEELTGNSTTTDINGYYLLNGLPSGLVSLSIAADGYPDTVRTTAVEADKDNVNPTITTHDIILDPIDSSQSDSISFLVVAEEGGSIESPDKRFRIILPPGALSDDAIITLMPPTTGPDVNLGDILNLDPGLGENDVFSLGRMIQVAVEPAIEGTEVPTINGWVVLAGRYFQSTVDALNLEESSIFPYYWDGTNWTVMQIRPYEFAVDEINNHHIATVNFSETQTGNPIAADLIMKEPVLLASLDDYIPDFSIARLYTFILAAVAKNLIDISPNVYIYDKDMLDVVKVVEPEQVPNDNALPLLMIHGWDPKASLYNQASTNPNSDSRYQYIVEDIVTATNGVYRPMFATYNPRSGIIESGNSLANKFETLNVKGKPGDTTGATGEFPYFDTFGFSMGGLVSRTLQSKNKSVHNMLIAATPNHGTHFLLEAMEKISLFDSASDILEFWSPGTMDLFPYDDSSWTPWLSDNPTLYNLNRSSLCIPQANMTLIAGNKGAFDPLLDLLLGENDKVVPVDSVFCRTTASDDGNKSLLKVNSWAEKNEYTAKFDHFEFGSEDYRIKEHTEVYIPIQEGLSDWVVGTNINSSLAYYDDTIELAESNVEVQYNVPEGSYDRVTLVIYAQDGNLEWHVGGTHADEAGNVIFSEPIDGNSKYLVEKLSLHTSEFFTREAEIALVVNVLVPLKPGQTTVPLEPSSNFSMPDK